MRNLKIHRSLLALVLAVFMSLSLVGNISTVAYAASVSSLNVGITDNADGTGSVSVTGGSGANHTLNYALVASSNVDTTMALADDTKTKGDLVGFSTAEPSITSADSGKVLVVIETNDTNSDTVTKAGKSSVINVAEPSATAPELPTVSLSESVTISNAGISITIGAVDPDATRQYALVNHGNIVAAADWKNYTAAVSVTEGDWDFIYRAVNTTEDALATTSEIYRVTVDTTVPVLSTPVITKDTVNRVIKLALAATDNGSGLSKIEYSVNNSAWQTYVTPIVFNTVGEYTVQYRALDKAGNVTETQTQVVQYNTLALMAIPTVRMLDDSPNNEYIRFRLQDFNIELFDYSYQFVEKGERVDRSDWEYCSGATYMEIDEEGEWDLYIMVEYDDYSDYAKVATCVIDQTEPDIVKIIKPRENSKVNFNITVDARDDLSRTLEYSYDGGKTWTTSDSKTYRKATVILPGDIQVRDESGNIAESGFCGVVEMDGRKTVFTEDADSVDSSIVEKPEDKPIDKPTNSDGSNQGNNTSNEMYKLKNGMSVNTDAINRGYVGGYDDGTFKPDKSITRAELSAILNRVYNFSSGYGSNYFDVHSSHWAYNYITAIQSLNMFTTNGDWFVPDAVVTRAELAHAICQFIDTSKINNGNNPYNDISGNRYYNDILAVSQLGIMTGVGDNRFSPDTVLTRAQVVTVVNRLIGISSSAANSARTFSDVSTSHWAYNDIMLASR